MGLSYSVLDPFSPSGRDDLRSLLEQQKKKLLKKGSGSDNISPSTSNSSLNSSVDHNDTPMSPGVAGVSGASTSSLLMGTNAPLLYEHALVGDWASLVHRIKSHPREAKYLDKCKNTPLHVSCRRQPPLSVVTALLKAYPEAVTLRTLDGLTPLHFACYCGSDLEVVKLVMPHYHDSGDGNHQGESPDDNKDHSSSSRSSKASAQSEATNKENTHLTNKTILLREMVDRRGRTPLHYVCAGFRTLHRLSVIRLLLELDPSCSLAPDERGRTPLSLIVDDYAEELQDSLNPNISPHDAHQSCMKPPGTSLAVASSSTTKAVNTPSSPADKEGGELYECWQVATLLLKASYNGTIQEESTLGQININETKFHLLHAAVGVGVCPTVFIRLVLKVLPDSIREYDADSNLPLHIACRTVVKEQEQQSLPKPGKGDKGATAQSTDGKASAKQRYDHPTLWKSRVLVPKNSHSWNSLSSAAAADSADQSNRDDVSVTSSTSTTQGGTSSAPMKDVVLRSSSFQNFPTTQLPTVSEKYSASSSAFPKQEQQEDVTVDLLLPYPQAAKIPDEFGKLPFILAVEAGKPWKTCLEPLYQAYADFMEEKEYSTMLQQAVDNALTSASFLLRNETINTLRYLSPLWPKSTLNAWVLHLIQLSHDYLVEDDDNASNGGGNNKDANKEKKKRKKHKEWSTYIEASILKGLAAVLGHVDFIHLAMPSTPLACMELATYLLSHKKEDVRTGASRIIGSTAVLLGENATKKLLSEVIFLSNENGGDDDDDNMSFVSAAQSLMTDDGDDANTNDSFANSNEHSDAFSKVEMLHGRAMACYSIYLKQPMAPTLSTAEIAVIKEWMKHDDALVRKASCLVVGSVLASPQNNHSIMKEFRSSILKCMRATEDVTVLVALAKGLSLAAKRKPKLFIRKSGMPILDAALLLSMTSGKTPIVQNSYHVFLWWALGVDSTAASSSSGGAISSSTHSRSSMSVDDDGDDYGEGQKAGKKAKAESGSTRLQNYMKLAQGENGRIMMTLVTKTLPTKMAHYISENEACMGTRNSYYCDDDDIDEC